MRHSYIPFIIIAGIALFSCARVSEIEQPTEAQKGTYTYTISASSQGTKTSYDADGTFSWTAGDAISVLFHNGSDNKFFTLTTSNSGALASFTGEIEDGYTIGASDGTSEDLKIWALYPASDKHSYTEGSYPSFYVQPEVDFTNTHQSANIPMYDLVAAEGGELYFKNLASTIKFVVNGVKAGVNKIGFTINNKTTWGLSGSWDIHFDQKFLVNYGYAEPGVSSKSFLSYTSNVTDGSAEFYVSFHGAYGTFWPYITITNVATGRTIKSFDATTAKSLHDMSTIPVITLDVSEENGGDYYVAAVTIDDSIADWADVHHTITPASNSNRIAEWKYTKDSKNLYILYKVPTSIMNDGKYFYLGVDADNNAETGADPNAGSLGAGLEYYRSFRPWRYDDTAQAVKNRVAAAPGSGSTAYSYNSGSSAWETKSSAIIVGGLTVDSYNYIEVQIPLNEIGSPSGQIRITHTFDEFNIGSALIMPEATTISAEDQTVDAGKTVSIAATTNSTATLSYSSDDTGVATVDANGVITGVAAGTATITVSAAAVAGEYSSASKDITVTVTTPFVPAITIDGDMSDWDPSNNSALTASNYRAGTTPEVGDKWKEFKVAYDLEYVYFYAKRNYNLELWDAAGSESSGYFWFKFDMDNDGVYDKVFYVRPFTVGVTPKGFVSNPSAHDASGTASSSFTMACEGTYDESIVEIEFSVLRSDLGIAKNDVIYGINSNANKSAGNINITESLTISN